MADDCRCQNCGNTGRFVVVVTNPNVNGQWCRNACSRLCAHILAMHGIQEIDIQSNYQGGTASEIRPQLSGRDAQTVHLS